MKVLFFSPYVYVPEFEEHRKNKSGFGFMVPDIARSVSKLGHDVVIAVHAFGPKRKTGEFTILPNSAWANLIHGKYMGIFRMISSMRVCGASSKEIIRGLYYYLNIGYLKYLIKKEKPDVVHIHGVGKCGDETYAMLRKLEVPFVVTLHGLLEDEFSGATEYLRCCEKELIRTSYEKRIPITVIGSGMKEECHSDYYGAKCTDNITVVTNGIDVTAKTPQYDLREKLGIAADKKIILSVGSVCPNKNQKQTVRALSLLPPDLRENSVLVLVGAVRPNYSVAEEVEALELKEQVFCVGFVPREELCNYYAQANVTVVASKAEGFGLSMAESFVYGVPCVAFSDLAAIADVYDEKAVLLCQERSDEALADAISQALNANWNKEKIMEHSQKFSLEVMAQQYRMVYQSLLRQ